MGTRKKHIKEEFLHYLWRTRQIDVSNLQDHHGRKLSIIRWGQYNTDSGPDFKQAVVDIAGTKWFGHIELHVRSSEWYDHGHQHDPSYESVVLHVVYENDRAVLRKDGSVIPTLSLANRIDTQIYQGYIRLASRLDAIPCDKLNEHVSPVVWTSWIDALVSDRLKRKTEKILDEADIIKLDWDLLLLRYVAKYLGGINGQAMFKLMTGLPLGILLRERHNPDAIPAILFGRAGLLPARSRDGYVCKLKNNYDHLRQKHHIIPMKPVEWKFSRMRPSGFPTVRVAQMAEIIRRHGRLFDLLIKCSDVQAVIDIFRAIEIHDYWRKHYRFGRLSKARNKKMGYDIINTVIINAIVPVMYTYGVCKSEIKHIELALEILRGTRAENNAITRRWEKNGKSISDGWHSQGFIQLYTEYCLKRRCLDCRIGHDLLRPH